MLSYRGNDETTTGSDCGVYLKSKDAEDDEESAADEHDVADRPQ